MVLVFSVSVKVNSLLRAFLLLLSFRRANTVGIVGQSSVVMDWNQIGNAIDGEECGDEFGFSVAMSADGTTIAIGATLNDVDGSFFNAGHVRVYALNDTSDQYTQLGPDLDGKDRGDRFGSSLAMSGDGTTIAIGASYTQRCMPGAGFVQVFRVNTTQSSAVEYRYQQIGSVIHGEAANDWFGYSLAMSANGNTLVAGAPFNDGNGLLSGHARVFKLDVSSSKGYTQIGPDLDGAEFDFFGESVAMSADGAIIAVGGTGNTDEGNGAGRVRVYKFDVYSSQYDQIGSDIIGEAPRDSLGSSLAMSADGSTIAVGSRGSDGSGKDAGKVRVYQINSFGQEYLPIGFAIDGEAACDFSGYSVAMSADGTTIAVGAIYNDGSKTYDTGHVRVYQLDPNDQQYKQIGSDIDGEGGRFSSTLDISDNGTIIVVGAYTKGRDTGQVRVFRFSSREVNNTPVPFRAPVLVRCGLLCSVWNFFLCSFFGLCPK